MKDQEFLIFFCQNKKTVIFFMSTIQQEEALGISMTDWMNFLSNLVMYFFILVWPCLKTVASINNQGKKGTHRGTLSTYWMGVSVILLAFQIGGLFFYKFKLFPIIQMILSFICSLGDGKIVILIGSKIVYPLFYKYYAFFRNLPNQISNLPYYLLGGLNLEKKDKVHHHAE